MMTIESAQDYKEQVTAILAAAKLPVIDLPETRDTFIVAIVDNKVTGVAGMEIFGNYGLLRSVAVEPGYRGMGIAAKLVSRIEALGSLKGLLALYLLTETAPEYFGNKGYQQLSREQVPADVQRSSEFGHVCPASSIVMKKEL
jgi:amino-acid N-acetyltransferase